MQTPQTEIYHETVVIPLFEIVIYPDSRTKFNVDKATGELLLETLKNGGAARALGLTVKSGTRQSEVTTESLYQIGNLFPDPRVEPDGRPVLSRAGRQTGEGNFRHRKRRHVLHYVRTGPRRP